MVLLPDLGAPAIEAVLDSGDLFSPKLLQAARCRAWVRAFGCMDDAGQGSLRVVLARKASAREALLGFLVRSGHAGSFPLFLPFSALCPVLCCAVLCPLRCVFSGKRCFSRCAWALLSSPAPPRPPPRGLSFAGGAACGQGEPAAAEPAAVAGRAVAVAGGARTHLRAGHPVARTRTQPSTHSTHPTSQGPSSTTRPPTHPPILRTPVRTHAGSASCPRPSRTRSGPSRRRRRWRRRATGISSASWRRWRRRGVGRRRGRS